MLFLLLLGLFPALAAAESAVPTAEYAPDRILLQPKPSLNRKALADFHAAQKSSVLRSFEGLGDLQVVSVPKGDSVPGLIAKYQQSGLVQFAEPDYIVHANLTPNDPKFVDHTLWGLTNIQAPAAWNVRTDATNIIVAVLDSGIRYTHEDLAANMWANPADGSHGWNAIAGSNDPWDDAVDGHGTRMAGIIGAVGNNGTGVVGVAWRVQLMACKCLDSAGNGTNSDIITCMEFARTNGARVFNASWSALGNNFSQSMSNAIYAARSAGILFVTSVGNNYPNVNIDVTPCYPANYQVDNIVTVTYTTANDTPGFLSNYGATNVDLAAPGDAPMYCTFNSSDSAYYSNAYEVGTSFAAAYVSGAFALLLAEYPNENYQQSITRLLNTTDPVAALKGKCRTGGRLNLRKALTPILLTGSPAADGGSFELRVSATTNLTCILQASSDLSLWSPIFTNSTGTSGSFPFTDSQSPRQGQRFYRAVMSP